MPRINLCSFTSSRSLPYLLSVAISPFSPAAGLLLLPAHRLPAGPFAHHPLPSLGVLPPYPHIPLCHRHPSLAPSSTPSHPSMRTFRLPKWLYFHPLHPMGLLFRLLPGLLRSLQPSPSFIQKIPVLFTTHHLGTSSQTFPSPSSDPSHPPPPPSSSTLTTTHTLPRCLHQRLLRPTPLLLIRRQHSCPCLPT